jgi:hypothetical protein
LKKKKTHLARGREGVTKAGGERENITDEEFTLQAANLTRYI